MLDVNSPFQEYFVGSIKLSLDLHTIYNIPSLFITWNKMNHKNTRGNMFLNNFWDDLQSQTFTYFTKIFDYRSIIYSSYYDYNFIYIYKALVIVNLLCYKCK